MRKIIHVDMDAFYASVELRENPHLLGLPVVVAWDSPRSVICAASYEARQFGLRSAMSVSRAKQLCPQAVYIAPHFDLYRQVSGQIRTIFESYTSHIEPLSLDEAYLDVTHNLRGLASATEVANSIRADIFAQTQLTASAGVAPNKLIAKIASDMNKPNGICVVSPKRVLAFLLPLGLEKIPGIGKVSLMKFHRLGMYTVADLSQRRLDELVHHFGVWGYRLYDLARGIDERPVEERQEAKQISTETTFEVDLPIEEMVPQLNLLIEKLWRQLVRKQRYGRRITLKLKSAQFKTYTRSRTFAVSFHSEDDLQREARQLLDSIGHELAEPYYRLLGIGLSEFADYEELQGQLL